jgi:hypothetical protein
MYSTFYRMRGFGALFVMSRYVPLQMLKALDMGSRAFELMRGHYFKRCWRTGQVRPSPQRHYLADGLGGDI